MTTGTASATALCIPAPADPQRGRMGAEWPFTPDLRPVPIRLPPVTDETIGSYLTRIAIANECESRWLIEQLGHKAVRTQAIAGVSLKALAALTGHPAASLARALPEFSDHTAATGAPAEVSLAPRRSITCRSLPLADPIRLRELRPACGRCIATSLGGTTAARWSKVNDHVCRRHRIWIGEGTSALTDQFDLTDFPEIISAQYRLHRLTAVRGTAAISYAMDEAWYALRLWRRREQVATAWGSREQRLRRHEDPFNADWIIHAAALPEAVALAAALSNPYWRRLAASGAGGWLAFTQQVGSKIGLNFRDRDAFDPMHQWHSDELAAVRQLGMTRVEAIGLDSLRAN